MSSNTHVLLSQIIANDLDKHEEFKLDKMIAPSDEVAAFTVVCSSTGEHLVVTVRRPAP